MTTQCSKTEKRLLRVTSRHLNADFSSGGYVTCRAHEAVPCNKARHQAIVASSPNVSKNIEQPATQDSDPQA